MKIFRKRILPTIWLSAFVIGVLFLGLAGATAKASDNQDEQKSNGFSLAAVSENLFGSAFFAANNALFTGETLQFSQPIFPATESQGTVPITVTRTGSTTDVVQVTFFTSNGTAFGGAACDPSNGNIDFVNSTGTLTFQAGVTSQTFSIQICNDNVFEPNPNPEAFNINLVNPTNGALIGSPSAAIVNIADDDSPTPGRIRFNPTTYSVNEGAGTLTLNIERVTGTDSAVSATVTFTDGSAIGGASCATPNVDYINTPRTVNFAVGSSAPTTPVTVEICDDGVFEGDPNNPNEFFTATLTSPQGGAIIGADSAASITIIDNDANVPGTLNFSNTATNQSFMPIVREGIPGLNTILTLTVIRSVGQSGPVTATVSLLNGGAIGGPSCDGFVDFINTPQTISFGPNQTTQTIQVTICDDNVDEVPQSRITGETFTVRLGDPQTSNQPGSVIFGPQSSATVTILDTDNGVFRIGTNPQTVMSVNEGGGFAIFTVTREFGVQGAVTVNYQFSNGNVDGANSSATGGASCATPGVDFINTTGTLSFGPNITQQQFVVQICDDSVFETGTISTSAAITPETFRVTLTDTTGGALLGTDGIPASPGINLTNQVALPVTQVVEITENDVVDNPGTITFTTGNLTVNEGLGGVGNNTTLTFTLNRSGNGNPLDANAAVPVSVLSTNGATAGTSCGAANNPDFVVNSSTVSFLGNRNGDQTNQTATFTVTICNDTAFEGTESFTLTLGQPTTNAGLTAPTLGTPSTVTVTISDDDANAGTITVNPAEVTVSEAATFVTIPVTRSGGLNGNVQVPFTFSNGPASANVGVAMGGASCTNQNDPATAVDYVNTFAGGNFITFQNNTDPNATTQTVNITVQICNDNADEFPDLERFQVILGPQGSVIGGGTIGANNTATVLIADDEQGTLQFSAATQTVTEGTNPPNGTTPVTITVNRANTQGNVTVQYTVNNGTGANGAIGGAACGGNVDFIIPGGAQTLTFGNGVSSQNFTVLVCADAFDEQNETFTVTLTNPGGGALLGATTTQTITIDDDDATPSLSISDVTLAEGNGANTTFNFIVTLAGGQTNQPVTVNFATANGPAPNGATGGAVCGGNVDYLTTSGTLTFDPGTTTRIIPVTVCGDLNVEPNETFFVNLTAPAGANATISDNQGLGTINNDDGTLGTISIGDVRIVEGNAGTSTATVTLNLTGNPNAQNVTVNFATSSTGGTAQAGPDCATPGTDYVTNTNGGNPIVFTGAGNSTQTFTITICGDTRKEANEILFVNLSNAGGNATIADNQGFIIIIDDDRPIRADFDIDRRTDLSVFRPSNGFWYIQQSFNNLLRAVQFGQNGDIPVPGDYDGDRATDLAYFRPSTSTFSVLLSATNQVTSTTFGGAGDIPVQGDYNGDGITEIAIFRPSTGTFFTSQDPNTNFGAIQFGQNGDIPIPADYDGDFRTDIAVFRPTGGAGGNAAFFVRPSSGAAPFGISFGLSTDIPVIGDFDGDGKNDFTVFRAGTAGNPAGVQGAFYTFRSLTQSFFGVSFGQPGDIPSVGDYDGDGTDDYAVFRPNFSGNAAAFFFLNSSSNFATAGGQQFGSAGDIPIPSRYQSRTATQAP
jgi:hypothetical protein